MKSIFVAVLATSLAAMPSHAQASSSSDTFTPEFGEGLAKGKAPCELPRIRQAIATHRDSLPLGAGMIELPVDFTAEPQERPSSKRWIAADSTTFTVLVAASPMGGLAHSGGGGVKFDSAPACAVLASGHHAMVERVRVVMSADTMYLAIIPVFARAGAIVNGSVEARSEKRRDEIIAYFTASTLAR
ncbi:MAG TPA: hypothetical protein VGJ12_01000 [Gemmatimonadaceae bacterium]